MENFRTEKIKLLDNIISNFENNISHLYANEIEFAHDERVNIGNAAF